MLTVSPTTTHSKNLFTLNPGPGPDPAPDPAPAPAPDPAPDPAPAPAPDPDPGPAPAPDPSFYIMRGEHVRSIEYMNCSQSPLLPHTQKTYLS